MAKYININDSTTADHTLIARSSTSSGKLKSISFCNKSTTKYLLLTLFLSDGIASPTVTYILIQRLKIPAKTTFVYDENPIKDIDTKRFSLVATLTTESGNRFLDIIIN
tara:strand:+ start:13509 stop:13835 length:327 start_codon:yes stop_codon:yes gene_type:complete